jgi:hypothetical protein
MKDRVFVRKASVADLAAVARLEYAIFGKEGIVPFPMEHFATCFASYPEGFFVAEEAGKIVGYVYAQIIACDMVSAEEVRQWSSFEEVIARGHKPDGNYHLGINIGSVRSGAGKMLVEEFLALGRSTCKPALGMSRISGFGQYVKDLIVQGLICAEASQHMFDMLALHYVLQCAQMVGGVVRLKPWCPGVREQIPGVLPVPSVRDPVLCKYLLNQEVAVYAILPHFLDDTASKDYSVLIGPA